MSATLAAPTHDDVALDLSEDVAPNVYVGQFLGWQTLLVNVIESLPVDGLVPFAFDFLDNTVAYLRAHNYNSENLDIIAQFYYNDPMYRVSPSNPPGRPDDAAHDVDIDAVLPDITEGCAEIIKALDVPDHLRGRLLEAVHAAARRGLTAQAPNQTVDAFRKGGAAVLRHARVPTRLAEGLLGAMTEAVARELSDPRGVTPEPPKNPPARWQERSRNAYRNPADFILRNYDRWLAKPGQLGGMTRAHLKIDEPLYFALNNWLQNPKNLADPDWKELEKRLPTVTVRNDKILEAYETHHAGVSLERIRSAARRRRRHAYPTAGD